MQTRHTPNNDPRRLTEAARTQAWARLKVRALIALSIERAFDTLDTLYWCDDFADWRHIEI